MAKLYDTIIIGGGAAGLTAATVIARARRQVLIIDAKNQSNQVSRASHGVFFVTTAPTRRSYIK